MRKLLLLAIVVLPLCGCMKIIHKLSGPQTTGSGNLEVEKRTVGKFDRIELKGGMDCIVTVGKAASIEVKADDNLFKLIDTESSGGTLTITSHGSYSTRNPVLITITTPSLNGFSILGAGDVDIRSVSSKKFEAKIWGSGDLTADGIADTVDASISGSGNIELGKLIANTVSASISGSGDIVVHATESLDASVSGSGDITYHGSPKKVSKSVSGSGEVHGN